MILNHPNLYACPHCESFISILNWMSANTFNGIFYSDGKAVYPNFPDLPDLTKCHQCNNFLIIKNINVIGKSLKAHSSSKKGENKDTIGLNIGTGFQQWQVFFSIYMLWSIALILLFGMQKVVVFGSGSFGTAMATVVARNNYQVCFEHFFFSFCLLQFELDFFFYLIDIIHYMCPSSICYLYSYIVKSAYLSTYSYIHIRIDISTYLSRYFLYVSRYLFICIYLISIYQSNQIYLQYLSI